MSDTSDISGTSGSSPRMSDKDFSDACDLYETGEMGLVDLARKFGVSRQALSSRFKKNKVVRNSRQPAPPPAPIRYTDKRGEWIEETRIESYQALRQAAALARKIAAETVKNRSAFGTADDDLKAAQRFNKILVENTKARLELLEAGDFTDEEDLPTLRVEDLTDQEILDHHKATGALEEDATLEDLRNEDVDLEEIQ